MQQRELGILLHVSSSLPFLLLLPCTVSDSPHLWVTMLSLSWSLRLLSTCLLCT